MWKSDKLYHFIWHWMNNLQISIEFDPVMSTHADAYGEITLITALFWTPTPTKKSSSNYVKYFHITVKCFGRGSLAKFTFVQRTLARTHTHTHQIKWMSHFTLDLLSIWLTSFTHDFYIWWHMFYICATHYIHSHTHTYSKQFSLLIVLRTQF